MIDFYNMVGYSGVCILFLGLIALFMAIRGIVLIILIKKQKSPYSIVDQICNALYKLEAHQHGAPDQLTSVNVKNSTSEISALKSKSQRIKAHPDVAFIVNTLMQVHMKGVYSSLGFLKLCAAIGPLLGLLGTVLGMVDVFSTLSQKAMPDPSLLAGGIFQALLTTVMGLTLAIPALIVHYYLLLNLKGLRNKINLKISNSSF